MIIAECGQNFLGLMDLATDLIRLAKENGADLCKFQLYSHEALYKDHPEIPDVELGFEQARGLLEYGEQIGIEVFFSVFDVERVKWCEAIGVKRYKLACNKWKDAGLLKAVRETQKPALISSDEYFVAWDFVDPIVLYCEPQYPCPLEELSLGDALDFETGWAQGYSDHTIGLDAAKIALAHGASIIEKHFSVAHDVGVDGAWSMTPLELAELKRWETLCRQVL